MRELQKEIIAYEHVLPEIDPKKEIRRSIDFLKDYLKANPFLKSYVLGISGGQDSTLTGKLCQMAIEEMREETGDDSYQFIAVRLPYGVQADAQSGRRSGDARRQGLGRVRKYAENAGEGEDRGQGRRDDLQGFPRGRTAIRAETRIAAARPRPLRG